MQSKATQSKEMQSKAMQSKQMQSKAAQSKEMQSNNLYHQISAREDFVQTLFGVHARVSYISLIVNWFLC